MDTSDTNRVASVFTSSESDKQSSVQKPFPHSSYSHKDIYILEPVSFAFCTAINTFFFFFFFS